MGTQKISLDYGDYDNFGYKKKETTFELSWEAPEDLEEKYASDFDARVSADLVKLEKELSSGTNKAKDWLKDMDKKLNDVFARWQKDGTVSKKDAAFCDELQGLLPDIIESLEKQRVLVFESMLETILDDAITDLAKKFKLKRSKVKWKKRAKILAFAVIALTVTALGILATIASFGVAAGPIIGVVGTAIGLCSTGAGFVSKAKSIWGSGKDEAKNLESAANAYAAATADFNEVLKRQTTYLSAKKSQLDVLEKQIAESKKLLTSLDGYKKNVGDKLQGRIDQVVKEQAALEKTRSELEADILKQDKLVSDAIGKKTFESAIALAATLREDRGILDKINDHFGNLSALLGGIGSALPT